MNKNKAKHTRPPRHKIDWRTAKRLLSYVWTGYKVRFLLAIVLVFLNALATVQVSLFIQILIDDYIQPLLLQQNPDFTGLFYEILRIGAITLLGILAIWISDLIMARVSQGVLKTIRDEIFVHMQRLPVRYFDTHSAGDIMSHYTNDTDSLRQMISQSVPQVISASITIVTVAVAMIRSNIFLALFVALFLVFMLKVTGRIAGNSGQYFMKQQQAIGGLNGYIEEMMEGQRVIKVFTHEEQVVADFNALNNELAENTAAANKYANILMPTTGSLTNLQYVLIAVIGGAMAIFGVGGLTLGTIASFLELSKSITRPFTRISQQLNMVVMALAGAGRIFRLLDEAPEQDEGFITLVNVRYENGGLVPCEEKTFLWAWSHPDGNGGTTLTKLEGRIHFYDVNFSYIPEKPILHDISMYAEPGQKVAFVGATGAGKTTITNLINRFYDVEDGNILYDGLPINDIKKADLRRSLGIVLQDTHLFTDTILGNIRYGRADATDEEVAAAAQLANAHSFITRLPDGYHTVLAGGGESLSQGQRQLLSIARAALADPPVMILDEATSSIDTRTEILVQDGMDALMHGRTVFVIAHRLSTIQNSDVILVMDLGHIVERGDHDKLLEKQGIYYQLYTGVLEIE